tara:strand:- start:15784 stop:16554 length:771 start_codon:yes stop_codon:yes gene_type:complete
MARKYKLGDKWSEDFDYDGMVEYGKTIDMDTSVKTVEKYADSLEDVNYHTLAKPLFDLEVAMSGDKEKIKKHFLVNYRRTLSKQLVEFGDEPLSTDEIYFFAKGGKVDSHDIASEFMDYKYDGNDWWTGDNYKDELAEGRYLGAVQLIKLRQGKGDDMELISNLDELDRDVIDEIMSGKRYAKGGETATVSIIYNDIPENHRIVGFSHTGEEVILDELLMTDRERAEYSAKEVYIKGMDRDEFWKKYNRVDFQTED